MKYAYRVCYIDDIDETPYWTEIGNLNQIISKKESAEAIREQLAANGIYPKSIRIISLIPNS